MDWKEQLAGLMSSVQQVDDNQVVTVTEKPTKKQRQHLTIEYQKRHGKPATIITGHSGTDEEIQRLAQSLKTKLAVGGSVRDGEILLQGDQRTALKALLNKDEYVLKGV